MVQLASFAERYAKLLNPAAVTTLNEGGGLLDIDLTGSTPPEVDFVAQYVAKLWPVHGTKALVSVTKPTAESVRATFTP